MKKIMGIDIGEKRIGIAVSDSLGYTAQGVETYTRTGEEDAAYIAAKMKELGASKVVVGLPLNMNGSEGPAAQRVREFADKLQALGVEVDFQDERLTTVSAERMLIEADVSRRKRRQVVDKLAAVYILRAYLDRHPV
ncbi:MAG: Holliday junction resolvase RuvX [Christensenellaceae bacterium]|nr:Holliday junction resolvase RuvX [Christensenellaceae bacterium]